MLDDSAFVPYPKISRLGSAEMTITEKIDGTNGLIVVRDGAVVCAGSRNRALRPEGDNFGFSRWVTAYAGPLAEVLGEGKHYGEWAGPGIQKNPLGLPNRRFFLFNVQRFAGVDLSAVPDLRTVPIITTGPFSVQKAEEFLDLLLRDGSWVREAAPGSKPEGIIVSAFGTKFKLTPDRRPKGMREE